MTDLVKTNFANGVLAISMNRPEKHNALSLELIEALAEAVEDAHNNADARVVVLAGEGKSFCAGMDLQGVMTDVEAMSRMLQGLARTTVRFRELPLPTITKVQGAAVGGGCGLAVLADFCITHPEAKMGYPEVDLGLCPAVVAPLLIKKIGAGKARAVLLQGGTMSGNAAVSIGMANEAVAVDKLDDRVAELAAKLASGGKMALSVTKTWLNELDGSVDMTIATKAAALSAEVIASEEAQASLRKIFGK